MIRKLLHIEQIKLLNYNPFRITLALYFLAFALGIVIYPAIDKEIPVISLSDVFRFPDVWMFLAWITEPYNVMLALIIIMITTKEFNNHTFKTQVIFGLSRSDLLIQKLLSVLVLSLFATLLVGITSLSLGLIYSYKLTFKIALENKLTSMNTCQWANVNNFICLLNNLFVVFNNDDCVSGVA